MTRFVSEIGLFGQLRRIKNRGSCWQLTRETVDDGEKDNIIERYLVFTSSSYKRRYDLTDL